ncbi:cation transporter [Williamsia sp.]|uniref:heavy-metal-associated domain-containing protein n=1 Tax=Williamsia sp. TaxID=1872085 RepID=UPI001A1B28DF|nr:cation transporter [Williamsia sp.]MBJ7290839.1 heavy-metal-associated domain-containing protein [Williamsia sp.]
MSTATFTVAGMTCAHCVSSVTEEVSEIAGVGGVEVDLDSGALTVTSSAPIDPAAVAAAVTEAGYDLVTP